MSDLETTIERLKTEATERWDDRWTVRVQHYADGDTSAFAFRSHDRDEDRTLVQDRLFALESDEITVDRITMEGGILESETVEVPAPLT